MGEPLVQPAYARGDFVDYVDRQGRPQHGQVRAVEAYWRFGPEPLVIYELHHPTYARNQFRTTLENIVTVADPARLSRTSGEQP